MIETTHVDDNYWVHLIFHHFPMAVLLVRPVNTEGETAMKGRALGQWREAKAMVVGNQGILMNFSSSSNV